jgi:NAD-dependent dihydropyrimidine dehydrogenase PreA subunit
VRQLSFALLTVLQTLFRLAPFPRRTGMVKIGTPGRDAPVLLTCNFRLSVDRVRRALAGLDAYLLVANSRGVNVWCAATGGLFTNHDVISALKTSGIDGLVDHRRVILPQLAATGIEGEVVQEKTGWTVIWGPVYAKSIPAFLEGGLAKTEMMRTVSFTWLERLEMAVAWAFPISLLALVVLPFWRAAVLPIVALVLAAALLIFLGFPLYQGWIRASSKHAGFIFFSFGERGLPFFLWMLFMIGLAGYAALAGDFSWAFILRWGLTSLVVLLILGIDVTGSTPVYKGGLQQDRLLRISLDDELCQGVGICEDVCPTDVFEVDINRHMASLARVDGCVQCGACIVQCPFDALYFQSPSGDLVTPETVRKFKLNLLGSRRQPKRQTVPGRG